MEHTRHNHNMLAYILFFAIFMNGFESGGYQVCLLSIGRDFQINETIMGILVATQLVAILIAPFIFGAMADRRGKKSVMTSFLGVRLVACCILLWAYSTMTFIPGIFLLGFAISMVQYLSIAALADDYPRSGQKKSALSPASILSVRSRHRSSVVIYWILVSIGNGSLSSSALLRSSFLPVS